ncbi:MAG: hypothetical protein KBD21_01280 [Candidatus Pacebacteria bacterium]|nr:hypothetical protein [Candidatus Paceibacterota bacterium]
MNLKQAFGIKKKVAYLFGLGFAVLYGFLLALFPLDGIAVERPDHEAIRDEVHEQICSEYDLSRCNDDVPNDDDASDGESGGGTGGTGGGGGGSASPDAVTFVLRTPEGIAYETTYTVPSNGTTIVRSTNGTDRISVSMQSALASLVSIDEMSRAFRITDLTYYPSFDSFYLNCVEVRNEGDLCGSWQYSINGTNPTVGLDDQLLKNGDTFYLFFGVLRKVSAPASVPEGSVFTAVAQRYDAATGDYVPVGGLTIGITRVNPNDPWAPLVVETVRTDTEGKATFVAPAAGEYQLGIKEDGYYPNTPLLVTASSVGIGGVGGGGGGGSLRVDERFDVEKATQFLHTQEDDNGMYGAPIYTDWAAIAFAAAGTGTVKIREYLQKEVSPVMSITDHERRAMALMALDISPYNGTGVDHIAAIRSHFKEDQYGDPQRVNDDIFALVVLERAGYRVGDAHIDKTLAFIVRSQGESGAWDESIDLTAAAIQALVPYRAAPGVEAALVKAEKYLRRMQKSDGGFGDVFATTWVLQAIDALGMTPADWKTGGKTPLTYLAKAQQADGGVLMASEATTTRVWVTAYAIPAALSMTWREVLHAFSAPAVAKVVPQDDSLRLALANVPSSIPVSITEGGSLSGDSSDNASTTLAADDSEGAASSSEYTAAVIDAQGASKTLRLISLGFLAVLIAYAVFRFRTAR